MIGTLTTAEGSTSEARIDTDFVFPPKSVDLVFAIASVNVKRLKFSRRGAGLELDGNENTSSLSRSEERNMGQRHSAKASVYTAPLLLKWWSCLPLRCCTTRGGKGSTSFATCAPFLLHECYARRRVESRRDWKRCCICGSCSTCIARTACSLLLYLFGSTYNVACNVDHVRVQKLGKWTFTAHFLVPRSTELFMPLMPQASLISVLKHGIQIATKTL